MYERRPASDCVTDLSQGRQTAGTTKRRRIGGRRRRFVCSPPIEGGGGRTSVVDGRYSVVGQASRPRRAQRERVARVRFRGRRTRPSWRAARSRTISVPSDTIRVASGSICPSLTPRQTPLIRMMAESPLPKHRPKVVVPVRQVTYLWCRRYATGRRISGVSRPARSVSGDRPQDEDRAGSESLGWGPVAEDQLADAPAAARIVVIERRGPRRV
jgi:hypothetical protein